ncbi:MAG: aldo/keto reductase [Myxococcales bacterium]
MTETDRRAFLGTLGAVAAACHSGTAEHTSAPAASAATSPAAPGQPAEPPLASAAASASSAAPGSATIPKRQLGSTGVEVSMLGLGGAHIGTQKEEKDSIDVIRYAVDHGFTFLDNCWDYNDGESEKRMGKALADGYRKRVFLMTKLDGRNAKAATDQLEQSLQRLQTDVIDLVQVHEVIRMTDPERVFGKGGTMEALLGAKKAGKLRFIGFTGHKDPDIHLAMLKTAAQHGFHFDTVQMPLNVMDPHYKSFEHKVLPVLLEQKIGVLGMKSMGAGELLKSGVVSAPECLRYALSLPTSVVITGCESRKDVDQAVGVATHFVPFTAEEKMALLERSKKAGGAGEFELFKTSQHFDGTAKNPHWLETAKI